MTEAIEAASPESTGLELATLPSEDSLPLLVPPEQLPEATDFVAESAVPGLINLVKQACAVCMNKRGYAVAAPQIGVPLKFFVAMSKFAHEGKNYVKFDTLFNPTYKPMKNHGKSEDIEGCLSFEGKQYKVSRYNVIKLSWCYYDGQKFKRMEKKLKGLHARIAQHEIDHLNGKTIVDRGVYIEPEPPKTEEASVPETVAEPVKTDANAT